jgi:hypothetical protein
VPAFLEKPPSAIQISLVNRKPHLDLVDRVDGYIKSARERRVDPRTVAEKIAAKIED